MISSAVLRVAALDRTGAAEAPIPNSKKARPVQQHRNGPSKTVPSPSVMREATTYGNQGTRPRHEDHHDHPARREDHHDHPRRQPMTAAPVNLTALERAIAVVLVQHGLGDHETVQVDARPIDQGGYNAGVTVNVLAYTRPEELPPVERAASQPAETAEDLEAVS